MAYIVPAELPKSCCECFFGRCKFIRPFWTNEKPNTKGYICCLDKENKVLEMAAGETAKAEWCPLIEAQEGGENNDITGSC